jgi:type I restriction enzyme S subunit
MTEDGLQQLRDASPGSEGRNRTLGLKALDALQVPVPDFKLQCWFEDVYKRLDALRQEQMDAGKEVDALLPAVLERAFRGEL